MRGELSKEHLEIVCGWGQRRKEGETAQEENCVVFQDERDFLRKEQVEMAVVPGTKS